MNNLLSIILSLVLSIGALIILLYKYIKDIRMSESRFNYSKQSSRYSFDTEVLTLSRVMGNSGPDRNESIDMDKLDVQVLCDNLTLPKTLL